MIFGDDAAQPRLKWAFDTCKNGAWGDEPDGDSDAICIRAADFNADLGVLLDSERTLRAIDDATYRKVGLRAGIWSWRNPAAAKSSWWADPLFITAPPGLFAQTFSLAVGPAIW